MIRGGTAHPTAKSPACPSTQNSTLGRTTAERAVSATTLLEGTWPLAGMLHSVAEPTKRRKRRKAATGPGERSQTLPLAQARVRELHSAAHHVFFPPSPRTRRPMGRVLSKQEQACGAESLANKRIHTKFTSTGGIGTMLLLRDRADDRLMAADEQVERLAERAQVHPAAVRGVYQALLEHSVEGCITEHHMAKVCHGPSSFSFPRRNTARVMTQGAHQVGAARSGVSETHLPEAL